MTSYKVAFIKTNAFKKKVAGKNYYEGYDNQVEGSVPIYPFYFTEDYSRSWDSGNTFSYSSLRNGEIESIDYDSSKLTVKFLNYDAFSYEEIVYEVGVPTTDEKIVDPSDHSKLFPFTPTEILVANSLNSGEPIIESLRESIMEFEQNKGKIPKMAETFGAELDEIQDDVAIVRNRMGDAVGNIDLNDHDVEGVSIEIYNDKGVLLEEIVLGSETFGANEIEETDQEIAESVLFTCDECGLSYGRGKGEVLICSRLGQEGHYNHCENCCPSSESYGAETFEARTHRKSYDWRNKKFVKRPDGKHNPGNIRGYEHSPRGTPDSKLDYDSANKANARIKANIKGKEDLRDSINFEANAKSGDKVYIITRRCEDYSAYRELDIAVFGSKTEAKKKFNFLFKEEKENYYADETIADAKAYMRWGEVGWGIESFMADDMIYELREQTIGNNAMSGFYFDAETFGAENSQDCLFCGDSQIQGRRVLVYAQAYNQPVCRKPECASKWREKCEMPVGPSWSSEKCDKRLYSNRFIKPRYSRQYGMMMCGDCVSRESYAKGLGEWVEKYPGNRLDAESFEANAKTFKKRKIDAETRKRIGKAVADGLADGFPDIFWSGLENGYPMTEKGFVDYVRIGCAEAWPLESDFREMRIVLEDNGYYDGWNEDDYEEPYTDEYLLKTMWSECKRQIIARAKRDAPKIVAQAKKEYGDKYDAESEIDLESHGKMNWTLNYDDYPNCCPFHQKYTDVMSNSMPCGDVLWGQGFSVDIEGTQYDIWGHEVND